MEFCYRYGRYFPGGVFWLNFDEAENVAEEVAAVGSERGLGLFRETEKLTLTDQIGRVQRAWQEPVPRLLVFDNCEDEALLGRWLPVTGGCRVLLTCRQSEWAPELEIRTVRPERSRSAGKQPVVATVSPPCERVGSSMTLPGQSAICP